MNFINDYDFALQYHLVKANIVANALSRKTLHMETMSADEQVSHIQALATGLQNVLLIQF
jgi:hypothetical protein